MFTAMPIKFEISDLKSENRWYRSQTRSIDLDSPAEPLAIYKKLISSVVVPRSNPSAMLFETDKAARSSCPRVSPRPRKSTFSVNWKTSSANDTAAFQTGNSSKVEYFIY